MRSRETERRRRAILLLSDLRDVPKKSEVTAKKTLDVCPAFPYVDRCRALVAQLDRATGYEPVGQEFESLRAHHWTIKAYEKS